ncbi:MAG: prolipoprotein diacylglyceryl transferase family protein, partial [Perlucidibaca sp.]
MIPYLQAPHWQVGSVTIQFFGLMVIAALAFGFTVVAGRARSSLVQPLQAMEATLWVVLAGLLLSHVVAIVAYRPRDFLADPWLLLDFTGDMSN